MSQGAPAPRPVGRRSVGRRPLWRHAPHVRRQMSSRQPFMSILTTRKVGGRA